jgi:hypothetical protein
MVLKNYSNLSLKRRNRRMQKEDALHREKMSKHLKKNSLTSCKYEKVLLPSARCSLERERERESNKIFRTTKFLVLNIVKCEQVFIAAVCIG